MFPAGVSSLSWLTGLVVLVRAPVPPGCPACRSWPMVWLIGAGDPEPPAACERCGMVAPLVVALVGVRSADV